VALARCADLGLPELWEALVNQIRLAADALATIAREAAVSADGCETGGILLGFDAGEFGEMLVMEAGDPGPTAERRPDFFRRDLGHSQRLADDAFARTTARWVGEWHTHPHGALAPSRKDLRTYRGFLRDPELHFQTFLAVIVGPKNNGWENPRAAAWLIERRRILAALLLPNAEPLEIVIEEPPADTEADE
jgi:integrative and conjugative element protein (TIGR02256 family)